MAEAREIAERCLQDPEAALNVLNGEEHPEIREAIMADVSDATEVVPFAAMRSFDRVGFAEFGTSFRQEWPEMNKPNVSAIATGRATR